MHVHERTVKYHIHAPLSARSTLGPTPAPTVRQSGCVICHEDFELDDEICRLTCCHTFHAACVSRWLAIKASCPLCNSDVRKVFEEEGEEGHG